MEVKNTKVEVEKVMLKSKTKSIDVKVKGEDDSDLSYMDKNGIEDDSDLLDLDCDEE